jgi:hypothetical protein
MNPKSLACVFIALMIVGMASLFMTINGQAMTMKDAATKAQESAQSAQMLVNTQTLGLTAKKSKADSYIKYLHEWMPYLIQTPTQSITTELLDEKITNAGLFKLGMKMKENTGLPDAFISSTLTASINLEDDYHKSIQWLGDLEQSLCSCRISSLKLTKGTTANNLIMAVDVTVPVVDANAPLPTAVAKGKAAAKPAAAAAAE